MISLNDFSVGYDSNELISNVNTDFETNKLTALIGNNGSGKSTLLKAVCGLNNKYKGEIFIDNQNLKNCSPQVLSTKLAYVNTLRPRMSNLKCADVVALGRSPYTSWTGKIDQKNRQIIDDAFTKVGMEDYKNRYFNTLSDGESQKIMIARAMAQSTDIIILDEPTSFLDLPTRYDLINLLQQLVADGKTIIYSTHELDIALKMSHNIALIDSKSIINLPVPEMISHIKSSNHPFSKFI